MTTVKKNRAVTFQANKELVSEAMTVLNKKFNLIICFKIIPTKCRCHKRG